MAIGSIVCYECRCSKIECGCSRIPKSLVKKVKKIHFQSNNYSIIGHPLIMQSQRLCLKKKINSCCHVCFCEQKAHSLILFRNVHHQKTHDFCTVSANKGRSCSLLRILPSCLLPDMRSQPRGKGAAIGRICLQNWLLCVCNWSQVCSLHRT